MTIAAEFRPEPISPANSVLQFVDPKTGRLTEHGVQLLQQWRGYGLGCSRIIPCEVDYLLDLYTLSPRDPKPIVSAYLDFDAYAFVSPATSGSPVTATVLPDQGSLATIKVYKDAGGVQAGAGDILVNHFYLAFFVDSMDGGAGGFVLK